MSSTYFGAEIAGLGQGDEGRWDAQAREEAEEAEAKASEIFKNSLELSCQATQGGVAAHEVDAF